MLIDALREVHGADFHALSKDQLRQIAHVTGDIRAEPTTQENELFVVVEGEFRVCDKTMRISVRIARLGPGEY